NIIPLPSSSTMNSLLLLSLLAVGAVAQDLTINTPVDTQPAGASHVADFENVSGTSITWPAVNASQGTQLLMSIKDTTGLTKTTAPFPVTQGSGDSCLTAGSGSPPPPGGSSGSTPPASSTGGSGSTPPSNPSATAPGNSNSNSRPGPSGSNSGTAPNPSNSNTGGAMAVQAPTGILPALASIALVGVVALFA
ncbi:hypothetical protein R3P38DRAFT_2920927, partial [Favolaschia claudopus]